MAGRNSGRRLFVQSPADLPGHGAESIVRMRSAGRRRMLLSMTGHRQELFRRQGPDRRHRSTIEAGEVMALVGQNGAGKSTLIKILTGAYRRDAGDDPLRGQARSISARPPKARPPASPRSTRRSTSPRTARWPRTSSWPASRVASVWSTGAACAPRRAPCSSASISTSTSTARSRTSAPRPGRWWRSPAASPRTPGW